jgi:hypothetical protein
MTLFSRAFIRKRMISLATTASVAATSIALAKHPTKQQQEIRVMRDAVPGRELSATHATEKLHAPLLTRSMARLPLTQ